MIMATQRGGGDAAIALAVLSVCVAGACALYVFMRKERFVDPSTASKALLSDRGDVVSLMAADPRCSVITEANTRYIMRTPGLAMAPGRRNTCYFVNRDHPLISDGCSTLNNASLRGKADVALLGQGAPDLSTPGFTEETGMPYTVESKTGVVPGFDACTVTFDTQTESSLQAVDDSLMQAMVVKSPTFVRLTDSYNQLWRDYDTASQGAAVANVLRDNLDKASVDFEEERRLSNELTGKLKACETREEVCNTSLESCKKDAESDPDSLRNLRRSLRNCEQGRPQERSRDDRDDRDW